MNAFGRLSRTQLKLPLWRFQLSAAKLYSPENDSNQAAVGWKRKTNKNILPFLGYWPAKDHAQAQNCSGIAAL